jgi:hypothetical protein
MSEETIGRRAAQGEIPPEVDDIALQCREPGLHQIGSGVLLKVCKEIPWSISAEDTPSETWIFTWRDILLLFFEESQGVRLTAAHQRRSWVPTARSAGYRTWMFLFRPDGSELARVNLHPHYPYNHLDVTSQIG